MASEWGKEKKKKEEIFGGLLASTTSLTHIVAQHW